MTDVIFETDGKTITCALCGNQYRTLGGALEHRDRDHPDRVV